MKIQPSAAALWAQFAAAAAATNTDAERSAKKADELLKQFYARFAWVEGQTESGWRSK